MAELSVELTAKITKLKNQLAAARGELSKTEQAAAKTKSKVEVVSGPKSTSGLRELGKSLAGATLGFVTMTGAITLVTSFLLEFGKELFSSAKQAEILKDKMDAINESFKLQIERTNIIEKSLKLQGKSTAAILQSRKGIYEQQLLSLDAQIQQQASALKTQITENQRLSGYEALSALVSEVVKKLGLELGLVKLLDKALLSIVAFNSVLLGIEAEKFEKAKANAGARQKELDLSNELTKLENQRLQIASSILKINQELTKEAARQVQRRAGTGTTPLFADTGGPLDGLVTGLDNVQGKVAARLSGIQLLWVDFATQLNQIGQNSIVPAIVSVADSIGRALAQGGNVFAAIGASLLNSFGQFLSEFGQRLIQYGVAALAFSKVSQGLLNPLTAGPSALAAIAIGTVLAAAGGALSSIASGGLGGGFSGGVGGSGSFSGSSTTGGVQTFNNGEFVFRISGYDLVAVQNKVLSRNKRLGGNISIG